jgi:hypothetical protein
MSSFRHTIYPKPCQEVMLGHHGLLGYGAVMNIWTTYTAHSTQTRGHFDCYEYMNTHHCLFCLVRLNVCAILIDVPFLQYVLHVVNAYMTSYRRLRSVIEYLCLLHRFLGALLR